MDDEHFAMQLKGKSIYLDLFYHPLVEMDRPALQRTLFNAQARLWRQILAHGNGPLSPDPWYTTRRPGENVTMCAKSWTNPETKKLNQMTFQTLLDVAVAVFEFLFIQKRRGSVMMSVVDTTITPEPEKCGTVIVRPFLPSGLLAFDA